MQARSTTRHTIATYMVFMFIAWLALSAAAQRVFAQCELTERVKLLADDGETGDFFGDSVAISGTTAIVGAYGANDNGGPGSAYLFDVTTGLQTSLLRPNDGFWGDGFGISVAISGTTAVVGSYYNKTFGGRSGSAYLYDTTTGQQIAKLVPDDGVEDDRFGISVAISGTTVVVGAYKDDDNGSQSGSAYLFDTITGQQIAKLLPNQGAANNYFGYSVGISGTTAIVGTYSDYIDSSDGSGAAYLFDTITGLQIAKLLPNNGVVGDSFGESVGISGTTAVVGASRDDNNGTDAGAAYLFDTITGKQIAKLLPTDGDKRDYFGYSVAIDGTTAAIGAWGDDYGSAYFFEVTTGQLIAKLLATDGDRADYFGWSAAISGTSAVVGAWGDDYNGGSSGSAYIFDLHDCIACLDLAVENLIAGNQAAFRVTGGTPGAKAITVYGTREGEVFVRNYAGYCATFEIKGVTQSTVIGGFNRTFDANGEIDFDVYVPLDFYRHEMYFQSAEHGTCPDECVSNLVEMVVQ